MLQVDLGPALRRVAREGAAFVPGALAEGPRHEVLTEVEAGAFVALPRVQGPYGVRQEADHRVLVGAEVSASPRVDALRRAVRAAVHRHARDVPGLASWEPEEITVQRYEPGSEGITVHRDGRRHRFLVAILTLEGSATLRLCADRAGSTRTAWDAGAGSLVLLRGPALAGVEDGRPLHAVDGPRQHRRTSLTLRALAPGGHGER